ncbi:E3 ubiquitin-protein ligase TRIM32 [Chionoecetes opilio]|uniref:E3 ubiquitin-protein ligase TRIM32 n=1 Tax=Chionoecetes opilio TaxID=41210 RepID=A0A8J4Y7C5_CHIOP|nr:E3 ubiquitin-protein ligase TRIM32 [Chionoecetes opilio]
MEEAVTCIVCLKVYQQGTRDPLVLPCGHTFCRVCISAVQSTSRGSLICPTCRRDAGTLDISQLPICYPLVGLSSNCSDIKVSVTESAGLVLYRCVHRQEFSFNMCRQFGSCRNHEEEQRYWCQECELPLCSLCLYTDHQHGHLVLPTKTFIEDKMQWLNEQLTQMSGEVAQGREEIYYLHEDLTNKIKEVVNLEEKVQLLSSDVEDAGCVEDILACEKKMKTLNEDNEMWLPNKQEYIEKRMKDMKLADVKRVESVADSDKYSARHMRIDSREGRLLLHSTAHPADGHVSIKMPSEVFLELGVGAICLGRIYIRLQCHLRRAQQFLALCMGTMGPSYVGSCFSHVAYPDRPKETLCCKEYWTVRDGPGSRELLTDLEWGDEHTEEPCTGLLIPLSRFVDQHGFGICTRGKLGATFHCPFGKVVDGMEVVRAAVEHNPVTEVTITHCGLVLPDMTFG